MSDAFVELITRYTNAQDGESPYVTAIEGLTILRQDHETRPSYLIFTPSLCIVAQGAKCSMFGDKRIDYRPGQALIVNVEMPVFSRVAEANASEPYLGVVIEFDLTIMREVWEALDRPPKPASKVGSAVLVTDFDWPLTDCVLRMIRLLGTPDAIPMLYPLIMREVCYWLFSGPHGGEVATVALGNNHARRIITAIHTLRDRFRESIRIEELATIAQMSPSAFHRQFKALTSMTPWQQQKQLRLLEARRLILTDAANVETASFQVGYESPSQFSREYSRMFGAPPRRDIAQLKTHAA